MIGHRNWWKAVVCTALAIVPATSAAQATQGQVGFQPATSTVAVGQTLDLALSGSNFQRVTEGGGVNLQFNPARVRVVSVVVNAGTWEFFTQPGVIDNTAGTVSNILFASFAGRTGNFPIATVRVQALTSGTSTLQLSQSSQNPFASGGQLLPVSFAPATVVATGGSAVPLPLPATVSMALLLGAAGFKRLRRKPATSTRPSAPTP